MHRISKKTNFRCGFTLTEMMIVVAIIIIIASVVGIGVADLIRSANESNDAIAGSSDSLKRAINSSETKLNGYNFG